jgi:hypothetical protein
MRDVFPHAYLTGDGASARTPGLLQRDDEEEVAPRGRHYGGAATPSESDPDAAGFTVTLAALCGHIAGRVLTSISQLTGSAARVQCTARRRRSVGLTESDRERSGSTRRVAHGAVV